MSVSAKGFVTRDLHVEALKDLDIFLSAEEHKVGFLSIEGQFMEFRLGLN